MDRWIGQSRLADATGLVIAAYFPSAPTDDTVRHLLWLTLGDCPLYLPPQNVWVVVDGDARTQRLLEEVAAEFSQQHGAGFHLSALPENHGKLWAVREGIRSLLAAKPALDYVVIRDCDGDHALSDMPAMVRSAHFLCDARGDSGVIVAGARHSRHRTLGWIRGELEALLDQVTIDGLAYALARQGRVLELNHCARQQGVPDLSSGYKVYGRQCAVDLFIRHEPQYCLLSESDYWHYGPETVPALEGALQGATIASAPRLAWDGQPTTGFGSYRVVSLYGELLAWVFARLSIPLRSAAQLYDNFLPHLTLGTLAEGRDILTNLRGHVLRRLRDYLGETVPIPAAPPAIPFM